METARFRIKEHTIDACHVREYPRATADDQEDVLQLAIKQYIPKKRKSSLDSPAITIIGAHANGFPKELYEPLWDDLYDRLTAQNVQIRAIWIADAAHQGQSSVLNEHKLGNDPSWADHPRDLFVMINHFRSEMKRPLVGIGHSFGGNNIVNLACLHPRLLSTIVLLDPVFVRHPLVNNGTEQQASAKRRDIWPSRKVAEESFLRAPFFRSWDPRVLDRWFTFGLRNLPTAIYPEIAVSQTLPIVSADPSTGSVPAHVETEVPVTLTTTKHQEVFTFHRANFIPEGLAPGSPRPDADAYLDVDPKIVPNSPFYSPHVHSTFDRLPNVRPSAFYIFGEASSLSLPLMRADKLAHTGIGPGGSGGVKVGRVSSATLKDRGHLFPLQNVDQTADACASWLVPEIARWRKMEQVERADWSKTPLHLRSQMSEEYKWRLLGTSDTASVVAKAKKSSNL